MFDLTLLSSRSMVRISLTVAVLPNRDRRLSSSRRELFKRASRSMNLSDTSSDPRSLLRTLPTDSMRSTAEENWAWGTRMVILPWRPSSSPEMFRFSTNPPRLSAISRIWTVAASTNSTSRNSDAVDMIIRWAVCKATDEPSEESAPADLITSLITSFSTMTSLSALAGAIGAAAATCSTKPENPLSS